ncbi:Cna B-type domain-containing protein [uncultured Enterococcus sp.]|uniref:Cna B-type domain-containing protein n=1 Tax=uncultured Enterococcus sp. TaxID=167972 RepID=UPI0025EFE138|nr:Cna B-type domain-containing protein [uncultured Enterococcus sp.]
MRTKKIWIFFISVFSAILFINSSTTSAHAAAKPLGQFYGGDNIDLGVYIKTKQFKFYTWTICGDHSLMPPDDDRSYPVTYDQYDLYEGISQFKNRKNSGPELFKSKDKIVASWFALSLDSDVLMDYYRDSFFGGKTPNDVEKSSFETYKKIQPYFSQGKEENFIYNSAQSISWAYTNPGRVTFGQYYKKTPYSQKAYDFSKSFPIPEETARGLNIRIVDQSGAEVNNQNPLKVDSSTLLTDPFQLTGTTKEYPVRADLTGMPYTIIDASGKTLKNYASTADKASGKIYNYLLPGQEYRVKVNVGTNLQSIPNLNLSYLRLKEAYYYLPVAYSDGNYNDFQHMLGWKIEKVDLSILFKVEVKETQVEGEKKWQDYNNKFNTRPDKITINLLKDGQVYKQQEVSKETNWKYQFEHLPLGPTYTITEEPVTGYTPTIVGNDITNTYVNTEKINKTGHKIWEDLDNQYNTRPDHLTFVLYQNDKAIDRQTVKPDASGNWSYAFNDLPKYDENGDEYKYRVSEVQVGGYSTSTKTDANGVNFVNKLRLTDVTGEKKWNDLNNQYQLRPEKIIVRLYQNDKEFAHQEVSSQTNWTYHFSNLPLQDKSGKNYTYTVNEDQVSGYEAVIDGTTITNNLLLTVIKGEKKWDDQNNAANLRPTQIVVELLQNGTKIKEQIVKADSNGSWSYTFDNLLKQDQNGKDYVYTVNEQKVPYYTTTIDGTKITNTLKLTEIKGEKHWIDSDNQAGMRPKEITIWLVREGKRLEKQVIRAGNNGKWTYGFINLPINDENGKTYTYTIEEEPVDNYTTAIDGTTIINTFKSNGVLPDTGGRYKQSMIYVGLAIVIVAVISGIIYVVKSRKEW